jgi:hypothetical protein
MIQRQLRFRDLRALGIVNNWPSLANLIQKEGFPVGKKPTRHTRTWDEDEVATWLATRPTARAPLVGAAKRAAAKKAAKQQREPAAA